MYLITNLNSKNRIKLYCEEIDFNVKVLTQKELDKNKKGIYINLSSSKKLKDRTKIKNIINVNGIIVYNYSNLFNKKTMDQMFKYSSKKKYRKTIEVKSVSKNRDFYKLIKFNPLLIFAVISYDKDNKITNVDGIRDIDIDIHFLKKIKECFVDV